MDISIICAIVGELIGCFYMNRNLEKKTNNY